MFAPAVPEPTAETSRVTRSPAANEVFAAVRVPLADVPAAATEKAAATFEPTLRSAVNALPTGAVVTATVAEVITPSKGILTLTSLEVVRSPGIVRVTADGADNDVAMFFSIYWDCGL